MPDSTSPSLPSAAAQRRSLAAAIACTTVSAAATGLTWPLLSLVLDARGYDAGLIGLSAAVQSLAIVAVSPFALRAISRFGMVRTMWACLALAAASLLLLPAFLDIYAWFPIRFVLGGSIAVLYVAGETWVNEVAREASRGRVIGVLGFFWSLGFGLGPLTIALTGIEGWPPYLAGFAMIVLAAVPLLFVGPTAPRIAGGGRRTWIGLLWLAPAAIMATLLQGTLDSVIDSFLALYGLRNGLDQTAAVSLLTILLIGVAATQIPMGWLADRMDRRALLVLTSLATLLVGAVLPLVIRQPLLAAAAMLVWGAAMGGLWMIGLVLVGQAFRGAELAAVNTLRGVLYGLGSVGGPLLAGVSLELWDPHGFPLVIVAACLLFVPLLCLRRRP